MTSFLNRSCLLPSAFVLTQMLLLGAPAPTPKPGPAAISKQAVISHLEQIIDWYRHLNTLEETTGANGGVLLRDTTHAYALKALQLAFDFAHADAAQKNANTASTSPANGGTAGSESQNIEHAAVTASARVTALQSRLTDLETALSQATPKTRDTLLAQRDELNAQLNLAKEIQKSLQNVLTFVDQSSSTGGISGSLEAQISDLQRTVPEAQHASPGANNAANTSQNGSNPSNSTASSSASTAKPAASAPPIIRPQSEGLITLIGDLIGFARSRAQINSVIAETDNLLKNAAAVKAPVVTLLRSSIQHSQDLADVAQSQDVAQLKAAEQQVNALAMQFRQFSAILVPIGEEQILVENTRGNLLEWRNTVEQQFTSTAHQLLIRAGALLIAIFFVLVVSDVVRRATIRYIQDVRRRRQFLVLRRILAGFVIAVILILGCITQFGSVATYAGFLTAGLALALQNVILSVVAYFFLIGRYGVRVGDRITISGVTGDVIELGLVRIYMMELTGTGADLYSTGRVVVYSNSVLFQPAALFKQIPGASYAWHSVSLVLASDTDFALADKTLTDAVNSVYRDYQAEIEKQHAAFERSVEMEVRTPKPECRLRFSDSGLDFSVRYPVESQRGSITDDQMMKALYDAIAREPKLTLAAAGAPKLQAVS